MERSDHSASCCKPYNTCMHTIFFFLGYCNCGSVLCLYKTLRKDTADSLTSLTMTKSKKTMERNQRQALCIQLIQASWKHCALCGREALLQRMKYCYSKELNEIWAVSFQGRSSAHTFYIVVTGCRVSPRTIPRYTISQLSYSQGGLEAEH